MEISVLLRRTLEKQGRQSQQLAKHLGVDPTLVSKWIRPIEPLFIPCHHLRGIAEFTGMGEFLELRKCECPVHCATRDRNQVA